MTNATDEIQIPLTPTVYMRKDDLIAVVRDNMRCYIEDFAEVDAGYRRAVSAMALDIHAAAVSGQEIDLGLLVELPVPDNKAGFYLTLLRSLLNPHIPSHALIGMTPDVFAEAVQDEFDWSEEFDAQFELYVAGRESGFGACDCVSLADED